jgi:hypothetical protein
MTNQIPAELSCVTKRMFGQSPNSIEPRRQMGVITRDTDSCGMRKQ